MSKKAVAIVVGGGPAPGINGVISAATIEAVNRGHRVIGIRNGFSRIMVGDTSCLTDLDINAVSRIGSDGGSMLFTSRENPTKNPEHLRNIVNILRDRDVGYLVTIGGDDTAYSARMIGEMGHRQIAVGHVPKTIDNDLPLPGGDSTFGFQSAREAGTHIVETLMEDAKTTGRWYLVVAMGRKAGHLALGIGVSSHATLTIVPEQFGAEAMNDHRVSLQEIAEIIVGSILKRLADGRPYGVAVLAEGLAEILTPESLPEFATAERDPHGNIRFSQIDFGPIIKNAVKKRLSELGVNLTVVDENVGYELRCGRPNSFDREYTRTLGFGIVEFLLGGGSNAMISRQRNQLVPIPFEEISDASTGKTRIRVVDTESVLYRVAQKYMIRLTKADLDNRDLVGRMTKHSKLSAQELVAALKPSAVEVSESPDGYLNSAV